MKDYFASIEKLRADAAEAALIRDLATNPVKRDMFGRLHNHFKRLADEVEQAMRESETVPILIGNLQAINSDPENPVQ